MAGVPEQEVSRYLAALVGELRGELGDDVLGIYALGGLAFGEYRPGDSDVDVYAVVRSEIDDQRKRALARRCGHGSPPCPARKLELVVICAAAAAQPGSAPRWELNLNTGAGEAEHVGRDPTAEPSHWFVIDLALARQCAVTLFGSPAGELIGPADGAAVRAAQSDVVAWLARHGTGAQTVAAACRAWHWLETGTFAGKRQALRWALQRL